MEYSDLYSDVLAQVPDARRDALEALAAEYGADDTFRFTLALIAASQLREWQLIRLFLRQLETLEQEAESDSG